jgi:hypothetical protein
MDMKNVSAARMTASAFGVLAGIGGFVHGIGEMLQGNVAPDGLLINSWVQGPIARNMGGEPGMTILPNLLITGILTALFSLAVIIWAAAFVHKKRGGLILILLAFGMMLFGGGFGPPILGMLAGAAGTGIDAAYPRWRKVYKGGFRRVLAKLWPWIFALCLLDTVILVIGSYTVAHVFDVDTSDIFVNVFFSSVLGLIVTDIVGVAYDIEKSEGGAAD